jgi:hypothetical protein
MLEINSKYKHQELLLHYNKILIIIKDKINNLKEFFNNIN